MLEELAQRLTTVLDGLGGAWEVVLVDDGSLDRSFVVMPGSMSPAAMPCS